ncbi:11280_t:CDS:2 [Entrophospora sp. SA101]|nr:11280_t:CDS:2 [Entrophospora sp. SA101]
MPSRAYLAFNIDSLLYGNVNEGHQWYTSLKCVRNLDTSCPHCSGNAKISIEEARKIATKNKGLCLSETYNGAHTKLKWQCEKKHEWYSTVDKVKNLGKWCPFCPYKRQELCKEIVMKLLHPPSDIRRPYFLKTPDHPLGLELDVYYPRYDFAVEVQGIQHECFHAFFHKNQKDFEKQFARDQLKKEHCDKNRILLIKVWYYEDLYLVIPRRLKDLVTPSIDTYDSLPIQIGWNLSVKKIDNFFERHDTRGYKFDIDSKGNVFIVEMESDEHTFVVVRLQEYFKVPNGGVVDDPPIDVVGASAHYQPNGGGLPSAPDVAIFPSLNIISPFPAPAPAPRRTRRQSLRPRRRTSRHNEIPPVTRTGRPHARIMCEVAVSQGLINLEEKCERWMLQEYVRCVFAIKIFDKDPTRIVATNQFNRRMIARLYTRQTTPSPNHVAIIGQPGVYFEEWEFGTLDVNGNATACNGLGLPAYQINIPVQEVFWNPPIVGGIPSTAGSISDSTGGLTKSK